MDTRSLALILYSRAKLNQDIKTSNEYKLFADDFKNTNWEQVIDRFHIQDKKVINNLLDFIGTI